MNKQSMKFLKIAGFFLVILYANSCTKQSTSVNLDEGLVAYYPFSGNAIDSTGNGNNGVASDSTLLTKDRFGVEGRAYFFNGRNSRIAINTINLSKSFGPLSDTAEFSISVWIKAKNITSKMYHTICRQEGPEVSRPDWIFAFQDSGTTLSFGTKQDYYSELDVPINPSKFADSAWHHLAATISCCYGRSIYVDGVKIGTDDYVRTGTIKYKEKLGAIGSTSALKQITEFFNGSIDELRFYNRALSTEEVRLLASQK